MIAALLGGVLLAAPADSLDAPRCPGGTVVTRADLAAAGSTTLHDALRMAGGPGLSAHGFDLVPVATVGVPFRSGVRVLLDGAPAVRGGGAEPLGIEALPVSLAEVERVEVCPEPGVAAGAFGGPWVDIRTGPPPGRVYGAVAYGNETGDPGPRLYLDPSLPNVDRWGPEYEGGAAVRRRGAAAWLAVHDRNFFPTDPAVFDRTVAATAEGWYPKRFGSTVALAARARGLTARLGVRRFEDMPFVPSVGSEVPLDQTAVQATVSGERRRGAARVWGHAHVGHVRLDRPAWSAVALDPTWRDLRADAALAASQPAGPATLAGGLRASAAAAEAPGFEGRGGLVRAWAQARTAAATGLGVTLAGAAAGGDVGASAQAEAWRRLAPALRLHAVATVRRALPEEHLDADTWAGLGYRALGGPSVARPEDVAVLRVALGGAAGRGLDWDLALVAQHGDRAVSAAEAAQGSVVAGLARGAWRGARAEVSLEATARHVAAGTDAYRTAWDALPAATAAARAAFRPDARLALWARLSVSSATRWAGFAEPGLPSQALLDLGVSKRAWGDRLRFSLGGRNVLGADERTHPLGASLAPRLFVRAEGRL